MSDILIIGGGVCGLSAGIYALMNGHRAVICERGKKAGGNLTSWDRDGCHIDNCIHWLTGTNPSIPEYGMWKELGVPVDVPMHRPNALFTCEYRGQTLSLYRDIEKTEKEMLMLSHSDRKEIMRFTSAVRLMMRISGTDKRAWGSLFNLKTLGGCADLYDYFMISTGQLAERFSHPLLYRFFTAICGRDFSAVCMVFVASVFCSGNGDIPMGGSSAMADAMIKRFTELGGELYTSKEAKEITIKDGRALGVCFSDHTDMKADYVIITADPAAVFGGMLKLPTPYALKRSFEKNRGKRFSSVQCAFVCDAPCLPFCGDLITDIPLGMRALLGYDRIVLREFSHEKSFAPAGKSLIQTMIFCDEYSCMKFTELAENKAEYDAKKQEIVQAVQRIISDKLGVSEYELRCIDIWTPATYKKYTGSPSGSYMSFILSPGTLPMHTDGCVPGLKNVILAGQWLHAPGGLPTAAHEGKRAAEIIERKERTRQRKEARAYRDMM